MPKLTSSNFLLSPYPPMNNKVILSFLLIEMLPHSIIFYHKNEEKAQNCLVPPARALRILCCTWSVPMWSLSVGLGKTACFLSLLPVLGTSGCSLMLNEQWTQKQQMRKEQTNTINTLGSLTIGLSPSSQELGLEGLNCYSKVSQASKNYNSCASCGMGPWEVHTQVCKNHYLS